LRKPRSRVYVRPGKDVTLYVPSDTPQEVCDYLNLLKEQGMFSSGVIEIITDYVQNNPNLITSGGNGSYHEAVGSMHPGSNPLHNDAEESVTGLFDNEKTSPFYEVASSPPVDVTPPLEVQPAVKRRLSLSEIFSQAKKNSLDKL
jgi:hypothetical protein